MLQHVLGLHPFLLPSGILSHGYTTFIYPSIDGHLGCFYLLAIMINAAGDIKFCVDVCFRLSWIAGIAGSHGNYV